MLTSTFGFQVQFRIKVPFSQEELSASQLSHTFSAMHAVLINLLSFS